MDHCSPLIDGENVTKYCHIVKCRVRKNKEALRCCTFWDRFRAVLQMGRWTDSARREFRNNTSSIDKKMLSYSAIIWDPGYQLNARDLYNFVVIVDYATNVDCCTRRLRLTFVDSSCLDNEGFRSALWSRLAALPWATEAAVHLCFDSAQLTSLLSRAPITSMCQRNDEQKTQIGLSKSLSANTSRLRSPR